MNRLKRRSVVGLVGLLAVLAFSARWQSTHQPIVSGGDAGFMPTRRARSFSNRGPVCAPTTRMRSMGP